MIATNLTLHDLPFIAQSSSDACTVNSRTVDGNTFDCYDDGDQFVTMAERGTGIEEWQLDSVPFDPSACSVASIADGGGNTFDCYQDGIYADTFPEAGTGIGQFKIGDSPFNFIRGDTFQADADGPFLDGSNGNGGILAWQVAGPRLMGDTFESFEDGALVDGAVTTDTATVYPEGRVMLDAWNIGDP